MRNVKFSLSYVIMVLVAIAWLLPLLWVLSSSLKTEAEVVAWPISWIPDALTFENFSNVFNDAQAPVATWFFNSFLNASLHTVLTLALCSMSAYAFARFEFRFRDGLFYLMLATMMIPQVLNLVPLYSIVNEFGWVDTRWALVVPGLASVFGIFLLRQFFLGVPKSLEEAALIDGAGHFRVFFFIMLPMVKPGLIVLGLFSFLGNWNDYMWPLTVINSSDQMTITIGLSLLKGTYNVLYAKMMTVTTLSIIPVIILFIVAQKYFMASSNMNSGIK
ncbi:carbohydrate ABC transporter permease [Vibrio cholerae]